MEKILFPSTLLPSILIAPILSAVLTCSVNANEQIKAKSYNGKTDAELARELANPNTPLTSLKFKTQYRTYTGDLLDADGQSGTTVLLQPTLPFLLESGRTLWVRPAVPFVIDQPVFDNKQYSMPDFATTGADAFSPESGIGDITIDVQYGDNEKNGTLWSFGATATLPTATNDDIGTDATLFGPGVQLGKVTKNYVFGGFINHQWDVAGDEDVSLSTLQVFAVYLPGGGWSVASAPIITHDSVSNTTTLPINFAVGKTLKLNGRPWKFAIELNYYVDQNDNFGPNWMIGINIAPVVENQIANWFR